MYRLCRHIKSNGLRCKSPALADTYFCYFHSKLHSLGAEPADKSGPLRLPIPEGHAAIQLSIARICDALITGRIDPKRAGQLLYATQIAGQHLNPLGFLERKEQVQTVTTTASGDELALEEYICEEDENCDQCPHFHECTNWEYKDKEEDEDEEDDDEADGEGDNEADDCEDCEEVKDGEEGTEDDDGDGAAETEDDKLMRKVLDIVSR